MIPLMLYIMLGLVFVLVVTLVIYMLILLFKERKEPPDSPLIMNFMSHRSNGRAFGVETNSRKVSDRHIIEYMPKDVDMLKYNKKEIMPEKIIVNDYMIVQLAKGLLSNDKNTKILLPLNPEELNYALKTHPFGAMLMNYIKMQNLTDTEVKTLRETIDRQKNILLKNASGELSAEHVELMDAFITDMLKMTTKQKEQPKFGSDKMS